MSNEHYRITYYSETEAKAILKKNEDMMDVRGRAIRKARTGIDDMKIAKELGMTLIEYMEMIG